MEFRLTSEKWISLETDRYRDLFFQTQTVNSFHALTFERPPPESAQIQRWTNRVQLIWQCTDVFRVSTVSGSRTTPDIEQRITRVYTFTSRSCLRHSIKTTTIIMYRSLSFIIITLLFFSSRKLSIFNWNTFIIRNVERLDVKRFYVDKKLRDRLNFTGNIRCCKNLERQLGSSNVYSLPQVRLSSTKEKALSAPSSGERHFCRRCGRMFGNKSYSSLLATGRRRERVFVSRLILSSVSPKDSLPVILFLSLLDTQEDERPWHAYR